MVTPVATPMAKLMPNRMPQNFVAWRQTSLGHEEKMIHGGQAELQPGELHNVHGGGHGKTLLGCGLAVEVPIRRSCIVASLSVAAVRAEHKQSRGKDDDQLDS
jgi:hypothetical protein